MKIAFERLDAYKVKGKTREFIFLHVSSWNGLEEWKATTGEQLILATTASARRAGRFADAFGDIFGQVFGTPSSGEVSVVLASPGLMEELVLLSDPPKSNDRGAPQGSIFYDEATGEQITMVLRVDLDAGELFVHEPKKDGHRVLGERRIQFESIRRTSGDAVSPPVFHCYGRFQ